MTKLALILQIMGFLFPSPQTNAYATQIKDTVVITVSYTEKLPIKVCVQLHELNDDKMVAPIDTHCWVPKPPGINDFDTWEHTRIDFYNFSVTVVYPNGETTVLYLTTKVNT